MKDSDQRCVVVTNYNNRHTSRHGHMHMEKRRVNVGGEVGITREAATRGGVYKDSAPDVEAEWWRVKWRRGPT